MIQSIWIRNFILIDDIQLDFRSGFSAFTGETGAGKSIVMDAIGYLCGDRMNASLVRHGAEKAIIEAVFSISPRQQQLLEEAGLAEDPDSMIVTRELDQSGKTTCRINHRPVTVSFIKSLVADVVDIHSQHDHQYLLDVRYHITLLDQFAALAEERTKMKQCYQAYHHAQAEYDTLSHTTYSQAQADYLAYQIQEIEQAQIKEHEDEELEEQVKRMTSYERLFQKTTACCEALQGDQGALEQLYEGLHQLEAIRDIEPLAALYEQLQSKYYELQDCCEEINRFKDTLTMDEGQLDRWNQRLYQLSQLKRKYGNSLPAVLRHLEDCKQEWGRIEDRERILAEMEEEIQRLRYAAYKQAEVLHNRRKEAANRLERTILNELHDLELPNARFAVQITPKPDVKEDGSDDICFMISMNAGEDLRPLHKVASGGELSRLMLGLKTIFTRLKGVELVIFDEIDTGVSGHAALSIGHKMHDIGTATQVFAVTHLGQVAGWADHHYHVSKQQVNGQTTTHIEALSPKRRIEEMAYLAHGQITDASLSAAQELFDRIEASKNIPIHQ